MVADSEADGCTNALGSCTDGLEIGEAAADALAAAETKAFALDVGADVGVLAGTLGVGCADEEAVTAVVAVDGADGCADGAERGVPDGAASGDAEVAALIALAAGEGCADAL
jgi:hypothetical protein